MCRSCILVEEELPLLLVLEVEEKTEGYKA